MKTECMNFQGPGFIMMNFTDEELRPIRNEVEKIKQMNFHGYEKYNYQLAGNIENEYRLVDSIQYTENLLSPIIHEYESVYPLNIRTLIQDNPYVLYNTWVNFQKKCEFNPPHDHFGVYSFVIWLDIPFSNEEELSNPSFSNSNTPCAGNFYFLYTDSMGKIKTYYIPVDRTYRNMGAFFPATLIHGVQPFFTSNDYRITVSGNFHFDNRK